MNQAQTSVSLSQYSIHGHGVRIVCEVPSLLPSLADALSELAGDAFSGRSQPVNGVIRPYDQAEVRQHLSNSAVRLNSGRELVELYQEDERFWLIDDRWGLCEINMLKGHWRSWILPEAAAAPGNIIDGSALWPIAQLLRPRGICLIPAAAVVRNGWGVLLLNSFNIEPELSTLISAGWRVVGQNWTALRDVKGQVEMLGMPGRVERTELRFPLTLHQAPGRRVDLAAEFCGSQSDRAACNAVMLISPGRRPVSGLRPVVATNTLGSLRRAWPLAELHPHRRQGRLLPHLAQHCRIFDVQLSRNPTDMLKMMDRARHQLSTASAMVREVA